MQKTELIKAISGRLGLSQQQTSQIMEAAFNTVEDSLKRGEQVRITGFGTFEVRERGEREGYHPQIGAIVLFPASKRPVFRPSRPFRDIIAMASTELPGGYSQGEQIEVETSPWEPELPVEDAKKPNSTAPVAKISRKQEAVLPGKSGTGQLTRKPKKPTK